MKKEVLLILVFSLLLIPFISADMNLRIEGTINNQTSDLWLKVKTGATGDVDVYDLKAPTPPSNYSQFASTVAGNSMSIDSWSSNPRTLNLTYHMSSAQTGTLNLSWNTDSIDSTLYLVTLKYFGNDSTYNPDNKIGDNVDMKTTSSYTTSVSGESDIYIQIHVDVPATTTQTTSSSGGGGGGGAAPSVIPIKGEDVFIGNKFMDAFVVLGSKRTRYINLFNQADTPVMVTVDLGSLGSRGILAVDSADLSFDLPGRTSKNIEVTIISPDKVRNYKGKIVLKGVARQEIEVDITVTDQNLLFDAELSVPWEYNIIGVGSDIPIHVKLTPQIENPRLDVKANYYIKDEDGNIIHEESKTFIVEGPWDDDITFQIGSKVTNPGKYYIELELEYPWPNPVGVATSRYSFEVREAAMVGGGVLGALMNYKFVLFIIGGIAFIILLLVIVIMVEHNKNIKRKIRLRR